VAKVRFPISGWNGGTLISIPPLTLAILKGKRNRKRK